MILQSRSLRVSIFRSCVRSHHKRPIISKTSHIQNHHVGNIFINRFPVVVDSHQMNVRSFADDGKKATESGDEATVNISFDGADPDKPTEQEQENQKQLEETINIEEYTQELIIELPDVGDDNTRGKVIKWYKQEGDVVHPNDTICDIETSLFTFGMDVEDESEGIMKEILVQEGDEEYLPGTAICKIMHKPME